ncbi:MAG TPA: UDP-N-acetylmuramate dehydrogenase [Planctomycetota bacterium]|nr:UDP-N-acetylmuramate dehydrogenase [Planctomycetota bacterium]
MEWSKRWFEGFKGVIREGVPLAPKSHIRIGGPARVYVEPWAEEDAALVLRVCSEQGLPWVVLGGGSNLLISDEGVDAVVIAIEAWQRVVKDGNKLVAAAGASLPSLLRHAKDAQLAGLECLIGIPAQVGGAVAMNAGTATGETFDRITSLRVVDASGALHTLERDQLAPTYRNGQLGDVLVTTATFELESGKSAQAIQDAMKEQLQKRNATQPVTEKSVGCIFKNPPGDAAGRLIQAAGLKGEAIGPIEVSTKHANYFVNKGGGTAAQVLELIDRVRGRVREDSGIDLELEVKLWGY